MSQTQRVKILVFAEYGWLNGGENSWLAVARYLMPAFSFVVACPKNTEFACLLPKIGIEHVAWTVFGDSDLRKSQAQIRLDIAQLIDDVQPKVVHANSLSTSRLVGPVTRELGIPAIGYLRDIMKLSNKAVQDINQLSSIIAVSNATRDYHIEQGLSPEKSKVIYNGVDLEQFRPSPPTRYLHNQLKIASSTRIILCVGQIGLRKATDVVIKSFLRLHGQFDDLALVLIGIRNSSKEEAIEFETHCRKLCQSEAAANNIFWLGRRNDVAKIMNESTLLLHAARQEPLGRVLLEALAAGLPFVATDVGGTKEVVSGLDSNVVLCEPDSVECLSGRATTILESQPLQELLSTEFRAHARKNFDIGICADRLRQEYLDLSLGTIF